MEICAEGWVDDASSWESRIIEADSIELALQWVRATGEQQVELSLDADSEEHAEELLTQACGEVRLSVPDDLHFYAC